MNSNLYYYKDGDISICLVCVYNNPHSIIISDTKLTRENILSIVLLDDALIECYITYTVTAEGKSEIAESYKYEVFENK